MRCDIAKGTLSWQDKMFQSTHLHEVRHSGKGFQTSRIGFNPRTYMRCDSLLRLITNRSRGFNPRTYMRCDSFFVSLAARSYWFQSTHLHEVRQSSASFNSTRNRSFNPRTYMRCDPFASVPCVLGFLFQSTHLHEVRPCRFALS